MKRKLYDIIQEFGGRGGVATISALAKAAGCSRTDIHNLAHGKEDRLSGLQKRKLTSYLQSRTLHGDERLTAKQVKGIFQPAAGETPPAADTPPSPSQSTTETEELMLTETPLAEPVYRAYNLAFDPFTDEIINLDEHVYSNPRLDGIKHTIIVCLKEGRIVACHGQTGAGKSVLLKHVIWYLEADNQTVLRPRIGSGRKGKEAAIISYMIIKLSTERPANNEFDRFDQLSRILENTQRTGRKVSVIFDEADNLAIADLRGLVRIWKEIWLDRCKAAFGLVFFGRDDLRKNLGVHAADEVRNRTKVLHIEPLSDTEARAYLESKIANAMRIKTKDPLFSVFEPDAVDSIIYRLGEFHKNLSRPSMCLPKQLNNLAAKAMLYRYSVSGGAAGLVTAEDVETALKKQWSL